jgi:hypothetical protein
MNKTFSAVLLSAALVLTGCGGDSQPNPKETVYVQQDSSSSSGFSNVEDEFIFDVAQFMTPALNNEPQEDVLALGYTICNALGKGIPVDTIISTGVRGGLTSEDTMVVAAAAVVNLCPNESLDNNSSA